MLSIAFLGNVSTAQSLRGKKIYVSTSQEVMIRFPSVITDYKFANKEIGDAFEKRLTNEKNFSINSKIENFKPTNLIVTEGENTHVFILEYKPTIDATETLYDYSKKKN